MDTLVAEGFATRTAERFHLTPRGLRFADHAAEKFLRS
jgi:DNA-binding IclR family transcriptional regulator